MIRAAALVVAACVAPLAAGGSIDWAAYRHDNKHTGATTLTGPSELSLLWNFTTNGPVFSSPAVGFDAVFIGTCRNALRVCVRACQRPFIAAGASIVAIVALSRRRHRQQRPDRVRTESDKGQRSVVVRCK
jgi:hypothetical protein